MVTARVVGLLFARLHQPAVIGEVVGGILLGPSLLGRVSPEAAALLLPAEAAPFLGVIAQLGVILYMFLVGLELDLGAAAQPGRRDRRHLASRASSCRSCWARCWRWSLYDALAPPGVAFASFALFLGVVDVDHRVPGAGAHPRRSRACSARRWARSR